MTRAIVIRASGTNCDGEMLRAFELAGAKAELVPLDRVVRDPSMLEGFDLVGIPGGFSYGDDIASGRIFAMRLRETVYPALRAAAQRGCPMIGACNGFQVLVQVGLLPGPATGESWPEGSAPAQRVALTDNQDARFHDRWVGVKYEPRSVCIWTRGLTEAFPDAPEHDVHQLPVAHGEGRFVTSDARVLPELEAAGQVALRYTDNYNGSEGAVAGICDASGRIFGLMPHPERYLDWMRHPYWTLLSADLRKRPTPGLLMFRNAVEAANLVAK